MGKVVSLCLQGYVLHHFLTVPRPHFSVFGIPQEEVALCLDSVSRGIVLSSWLASVSRTELYRFREFISWLRFGTLHL
jgi:hypothetical protein